MLGIHPFCGKPGLAIWAQTIISLHGYPTSLTGSWICGEDSFRCVDPRCKALPDIGDERGAWYRRRVLGADWEELQAMECS
eukprot:12544543-Heterocapsa_arctica.AAC.1